MEVHRQWVAGTIPCKDDSHFLSRASTILALRKRSRKDEYHKTQKRVCTFSTSQKCKRWVSKGRLHES